MFKPGIHILHSESGNQWLIGKRKSLVTHSRCLLPSLNSGDMNCSGDEFDHFVDDNAIITDQH